MAYEHDTSEYRSQHCYYCYDRLCWVSDWIEAETLEELREAIDELLDEEGDAEHERRREED